MFLESVSFINPQQTLHPQPPLKHVLFLTPNVIGACRS
jgi:hypothetical protein